MNKTLEHEEKQALIVKMILSKMKNIFDIRTIKFLEMLAIRQPEKYGIIENGE